MSRTPAAIGCLFVAVATTGCFILDSPGGVQGAGGPFDDDDEDDGYSLESGTYFLAATSVSPATCGLTTAAMFAQFSSVDAYAQYSYLDLVFDDDFLTAYEITGSALFDPWSPGSYELDFASATVATDFGFQSTFDCVLSRGVFWRGEILDATNFTLIDEYTFDVVSGTECNLVATSAGLSTLPCLDAENTSWQR